MGVKHLRKLPDNEYADIILFRFSPLGKRGLLASDNDLYDDTLRFLVNRYCYYTAKGVDGKNEPIFVNYILSAFFKVVVA